MTVVDEIGDLMLCKKLRESSVLIIVSVLEYVLWSHLNHISLIACS
jgi:hypothetical protein